MVAAIKQRGGSFVEKLGGGGEVPLSVHGLARGNCRVNAEQGRLHFLKLRWLRGTKKEKEKRRDYFPACRSRRRWEEKRTTPRKEKRFFFTCPNQA